MQAIISSLSSAIFLSLSMSAGAVDLVATPDYDAMCEKWEGRPVVPWFCQDEEDDEYEDDNSEDNSDDDESVDDEPVEDEPAVDELEKEEPVVVEDEDESTPEKGQAIPVSGDITLIYDPADALIISAAIGELSPENTLAEAMQLHGRMFLEFKAVPVGVEAECTLERVQRDVHGAFHFVPVIEYTSDQRTTWYVEDSGLYLKTCEYLSGPIGEYTMWTEMLATMGDVETMGMLWDN